MVQYARRAFGAAAALLLALACLLGMAAPASAAEEGSIYALANQSRAAAGLAPLALNGSLSAVALAWAQQMAANGTLSHNPSYSAQIPAGWQGAGENVAQGYPNAGALHSGWMNSPGHRANILGDFTDVGIAHIAAGGTTWSVQVFAKYASAPAAASPAAPAPAPAAPAPAPASAPAPAPAVVEVPAAPEDSAPEPDAEGADDAAAADADAAETETAAERPERASTTVARAAPDSDSGVAAALPALALLGAALLAAAVLWLVRWRASRRPGASSAGSSAEQQI